jgi:hypothetical protein
VVACFGQIVQAVQTQETFVLQQNVSAGDAGAGKKEIEEREKHG